MTRCEPPRRSSPRLMFSRRMLLMPAAVRSLRVGVCRGHKIAASARSVTTAMMMTRCRRFFFMIRLTAVSSQQKYLRHVEQSGRQCQRRQGGACRPLTTGYRLLLYLLLPLHAGDGRAGDFEERLVGAHDEQRLLLDLLDGGVDAARGDDLVARLQRRHHVGESLLALALGDDDQEVEDAEDEQEGHQPAQEAAHAALQDESEIGHRKLKGFVQPQIWDPARASPARPVAPAEADFSGGNATPDGPRVTRRR